ncbi:ABC transporter substrate-binding protein [Phenylobacterium sp.]|uniref:ABC transporter substrate-binding protein n=1 Tax=Phenylobacterium sp. TaxID=1871053 RepID=UPI003BADBCD0
MNPPLTRRDAAIGLAAGAAMIIHGNGVHGAEVVSAHEPRRVVSLNPCLDAILVQLADRAQIAALSHYSRDRDSSSIADLARTFPFTYESAEEVVALLPDLVLTGRHSSPATRAALKRLGVRAELFDVPSTVEASLAQVVHMAAVIDRPARGAELVARIRAAIAAAAPPPGARALTALVYQSNGFASAKGTLVDEMMREAGFINAATRYGLKATGNVPLERLIADPPDVLLAGQPKPGVPTWADRVLTHPALRAISGRMHRAVFPQRLMYCGGPVLIETAQMLAKARSEALELRS